MKRLMNLQKYKKHLELRYRKLIERANDYKYIDEVKSDIALFKAMKILQKIDRVKYLDNSLV